MLNGHLTVRKFAQPEAGAEGPIPELKGIIREGKMKSVQPCPVTG